MLERSKCTVTHSQIASGTCPHCAMTTDHDSTAEGAAAGTAGVRWNITRMLADLDQEDEAIRLTTILNLSDHLPPLEQALPVIRKGLQDRAERVRNRALTATVRLVKTPADEVLVAVCERLLQQDPADLAALHVLLFFYSTNSCESDSYRAARHALILRVSETMPEVPRSLIVPMKLFPQSDGEVFGHAKTLWLKQVEQHPKNVRVLENASMFFRGVDEVTAGRLLRRCKELEPDNPHWSGELGLLYSFQGDPKQPESYTDWGKMSLAQLEIAWKSDREPNERFLALLSMPEVALQARELDKARDYAAELLAAAPIQEHSFSQIWADRQANMVLGWLALSRGDLSEARVRLFGARTPEGSYLMNAFCFMDPLMKLVRWMLDLGHHEVVLEYLRRKEELVPGFRDRFVKWAGEIEQGRKPDFQDRALLEQNLKAAEWKRPDRANS